VAYDIREAVSSSLLMGAENVAVVSEGLAGDSTGADDSTGDNDSVGEIGLIERFDAAP